MKLLKKLLKAKWTVPLAAIALLVGMLPKYVSAAISYTASLYIPNQSVLYFDDSDTFDDIWEAAAGAQTSSSDPAIITLYDDYTANDTLVNRYGNILLDTNGCTLATVNDPAKNGIENGGYLKIVGGGSVEGVHETLTLALINSSGFLEVEDVTIANNTYNNTGIAIYNTGLFELYSGNLRCGAGEGTHQWAVANYEEGIARLHSGTIESYSSGFVVKQDNLVGNSYISIEYSTEPLIFKNYSSDNYKFFNCPEMLVKDSDSQFNISYNLTDPYVANSHENGLDALTDTFNEALYLEIQTVPISLGIWVENTEIHTKNYANALNRTSNGLPCASYDRSGNTLILRGELSGNNGLKENAVVYISDKAPAGTAVVLDNCNLQADTAIAGGSVTGIYSRLPLSISAANEDANTIFVRNSEGSSYGIYGAGVTVDYVNADILAEGKTETVAIYNSDSSKQITVQNLSQLQLSAMSDGKSAYAFYSAGTTDPIQIDNTCTVIAETNNVVGQQAYTPVADQVALVDTNYDGIFEALDSTVDFNEMDKLHICPAVTITLNRDAASKEALTVNWAMGVAMPEPSVPYVSDYIFDGWYTDDQFTTPFDFNTKLHGDITLYAKYLNYTADLQKIETALDNLQTAVDSKADATELADAVSELAAVKVNVQTLLNKINNYQQGDTLLKNELKAYIDDADRLLNIAVNQLQADVAELKTKVNDAVSDIGHIQTDIDSMKQDVLQLDALSLEVSQDIAALESLAAAQGMEIDGLEADLAALEASLQALNTKITALETQITQLEGRVTDLETAKADLNAAVAALQAALADKADTVTMNTAIANLQNAITALENAKNNYVTADTALKAELEGLIAQAKQEAVDAAKGHIPYIGNNGNWWIGDTDTGVCASGIPGQTGNGIKSITSKTENGVTTVTIEFTDPQMAPVVFTVNDGEQGTAGVGIANIEKTGTQGNEDTYTITLTNGKTYTFVVKNGEDGKDGANGEDGKDGANGEDGKDGSTPYIGENGNWWIGETDTGVKAAADDSISAESGNVTEEKGVHTVAVVAIVIAGIALLGNVLLAILVFKKKRPLI